MQVLPRRSLVAGGNIFEGGNGAPTLTSPPLFPDHCEVRFAHTLATVLGCRSKEAEPTDYELKPRKHEPNKIFFLIS